MSCPRCSRDAPFLVPQRELPAVTAGPGGDDHLLPGEAFSGGGRFGEEEDAVHQAEEAGE